MSDSQLGITVLVKREQNHVFELKFIIFTVFPMDYVNVSTILAFGTCNTQQCIEISIVDDMIVEMTESFFVTLERISDLDSRIRLDPVEEKVEITDNDGL